ncbi:hypothetical protein GLOIN_2v1886689 [Rhizophagus irregularis DAOM 181602=DAOM 197198]|nr:hypothetical protein GLOIN_2v1886689 [Rhizophagus irregularis DAOM 181602=DAOM 197198]
MAFRRPHPRQRRTCEEYKAELEEENYHLRSELQAEVDSNCQNEKQIRELERECVHCEQEIQTLNGEIERLENASKEEIAELKSEISSLKKQLYQAKKDIRDNEKHISSIESNSPDLYNSDDNMVTITELANTIDGYLNNRTTSRDILIDQIKRATRQIRRKENNLHQDLVREQRRRYDAEGERDLAITRRDLAEGGMANVIGDLHRLRTNAQNQVNRMIGNIVRKQTRIGVLIQEKFALQLLYQRNAHHLQLSRGDIGLLEFNRDRLYERYEKWKNKTQAERQNNLNLQGQIFALQNNLPHLRMAGYAPKRFSGRADEDIDEFIKDYRLYLTAANITTANAGGKQRALELFWSCLTDEASRWAEDKLKGKKWRLNHVRCENALANMAAVVTLNNANITAAMINAPDDEDWYLAGGCPVDAVRSSIGLKGIILQNNLLLGEDIYNQPIIKTKPKAPAHQNITTEDIDRIVNSRIQALQQSVPNLSPVSSSGQENITKADLQEAIAKSFQETMSRATKTLDNSKKSANKRGKDLIIRRFLSELLRGKGSVAPSDDYNYDPVDDITDSMAGMTLNSATINAIKSAVKSAIKKCSKCGRFGHTSRKCSVKKKKKSKKSKKGKVNLAIEPDSDSDSSSNTSSNDSSDSDSSSDDSSDSGGDITVNIAKTKKK